MADLLLVGAAAALAYLFGVPLARILDRQTKVTVESVTQNTATISWTPIPDSASYQIFYTGPDGQEQQICSTTPTATITGLTPASQYNIRVQSTSRTGRVQVGTATATTDIATAVNLHSITSDTAVLSYTPVPGAFLYTITYTDGVTSSTQQATNTTATITGLTPGTNYQFSVTSRSFLGQRDLGSVAGTTAAQIYRRYPEHWDFTTRHTRTPATPLHRMNSGQEGEHREETERRRIYRRYPEHRWDFTTRNTSPPATPLNTMDSGQEGEHREETERNDIDSGQEEEYRQETERNRRVSKEVIDIGGGAVKNPYHGLSLVIPPGALKKSSKVTIQVLRDFPEDVLKKDELLATDCFECLLAGEEFSAEEPVTLTIPHCVELSDPENTKAVLYLWKHKDGEASGEPERIDQNSENYSLKIERHSVKITLKKFSRGAVAFIENPCTVKGKLMSVMAFLPGTMPTSRMMMLELRMANKPNGVSWKDIHDVHQMKAGSVHRPVKSNDDEFYVTSGDLHVSCKLENLNPTEMMVTSDLFRKNMHTVYFDLDLRDKLDESAVEMTLKQTEVEEIIKFRTKFDSLSGDISVRPCF